MPYQKSSVSGGKVNLKNSSTHTLVFPATNTFVVEVLDCGAAGCQVSFTLAFA
jgi:hypothetical protein